MIITVCENQKGHVFGSQEVNESTKYPEKNNDIGIIPV